MSSSGRVRTASCSWTTGLAQAGRQLVDAVAQIAPGTGTLRQSTRTGHAGSRRRQRGLAGKGAVIIAQNRRARAAWRDPAVSSEGVRRQGPAVPEGSAPGDHVDRHVVAAPQRRPTRHGPRRRRAHVRRHGRALERSRRRRARRRSTGTGGYPYIDRRVGGSLAGTVAAIEAVLARSNAQHGRHSGPRPGLEPRGTRRVSRHAGRGRAQGA